MPFPARHAPHAALLAAVAAGVLAGCSRTPAPPAEVAATDHGHRVDHADDDHKHDHDHDEHAGHDHPETLAEGVAHLVKAVATVKEHLAGDARDAADDAVHELGHLLEDLQGLVRKADLAAESKAAATKALDDLFDCFDKLDTALHAKPGTGEPPADVHAGLADRINAAIEALREAGNPRADARTSAVPPAAVDDDEATAIIRAAKQSEEKR